MNRTLPISLLSVALDAEGQEVEDDERNGAQPGWSITEERLRGSSFDLRSPRRTIPVPPHPLDAGAAVPQRVLRQSMYER